VLDDTSPLRRPARRGRQRKQGVIVGGRRVDRTSRQFRDSSRIARFRNGPTP